MPECEQVGGTTMRTTVPVAVTFTAGPSDQGQDKGSGEGFDMVEKDVRGVSRPLGRVCDPVAFRPVGTHRPSTAYSWTTSPFLVLEQAECHGPQISFSQLPLQNISNCVAKTTDFF